jgi:undecaprenyl-diphosphatase
MAFGRRLWPYALGSAYLISAIVILHTVNPLVSLPPQWERIHSEVCGWPDLGVNAHAIKETMPHPEETFFFGLHYQIASELAFYTPGRPRTVSINRWGRPNVYDFWWTDADLKGKDGIGVTYDPTTHTRRLSAVFQRVDEPEKLEISVCGDASSGFETPVKVFYLYRCYGFKGGLRWVPGPVSDVRKTD